MGLFIFPAVLLNRPQTASHPLITQRQGGAGIFTEWRRDRKCDEKIWSAAASGIPRDAAFKAPGAAAG